MTAVDWDGNGFFAHHSAFQAVTVAMRQKAVVVDGGHAIGTLDMGTHTRTPPNPPFMGTLSPAASVVFVTGQPAHDVNFGSAQGVKIAGGPMPCLLRHFGKFSFAIERADAFAVIAAAGQDPVKAAGQAVAGLLDACALEWINGGYMTIADLAENAPKFREVLGPHIEQATAKFGLGRVEVQDFVANIDPL